MEEREHKTLASNQQITTMKRNNDTLLSTPCAKAMKKLSGLWIRNSLTPITAATLPLALLAWCLTDIVKLRANPLSSRVIGGRLSSIQAKAIDFACGALLAPVAMAVIDYYCFSLARVFAVNEQHKRKAVPLISLVEASFTSQGGFNPMKVMNLLKGRTWRLLFLSMLFVLSGSAGRMLSNLIAYEVTTVSAPDKNGATLRFLDASDLEDPNKWTENESSFDNVTMSVPQKIAFVSQMTNFLVKLNYQSAVSTLDAGMNYVGSNATSASLFALNNAVTSLQNVPSFNLSIDCDSKEQIFYPKMREIRANRPFLQDKFFFFVSLGKTRNSSLEYSAAFSGHLFRPPFGNISTRNRFNEYPFVAFPKNGHGVFLGWFWAGRNHVKAFQTTFGNVQTIQLPVDGSSRIFGVNTSIFLTGIKCSVNRQDGFLNYTRNQAEKTWRISGRSFSKVATSQRTFLREWQTFLQYQAPGSEIQGLGPVLAQTAGSIGGKLNKSAGNNIPVAPNNWTIFALNYLYTFGEAQRIAAEVAAQNASGNRPEHYYRVAATTNVQYYQITYIPLLLLLSLLSLSGLAVVTCAMAFYARNSCSSRQGREIDSLRLLIDSVTGLKDSAPEMAMTGEMSKWGLIKWASKYRVRYDQIMEGDEVTIRLVRSDPEPSIESTKIWSRRTQLGLQT